jgi:poly(3-hydroxybutyrate) depolymerase
MNSRTALLSAVLSALALIASNATAATRTESAPAAVPASALTTLAKHGADDAVDPFDDHGVDVILAKHGADDLVDGEDDHGVDFILG